MARFEAEHDDTEQDDIEATSAADQPDGNVVGRPADVARQVGRALWGRDLLGPRPGWWPWGAGARARAQRRRELRATGAQRRAQLQRQFTQHQDRGSGAGNAQWRPVPIRRHIAVITALVAVVAAVVGLAWSADDEPGAAGSPQDDFDEPMLTAAISTTSSQSTSPAPSGGVTSPVTSSLPEQPPIPSSGVAPTVVHPRTAMNPTMVVVVAPPAGPPVRQELAGPEEAARAWLARWCPFTTIGERFGDAERRAQPVMTESAWSLFDPGNGNGNDDRAARSWQQAVDAGESGACSAPVAKVVPSAPRTPDQVVVRVTADRVVTTAAGTRYVEQVTSTRVVLRQADGTWRVDLAATGG